MMWCWLTVDWTDVDEFPLKKTKHCKIKSKSKRSMYERFAASFRCDLVDQWKMRNRWNSVQSHYQMSICFLLSSSCGWPIFSCGFHFAAVVWYLGFGSVCVCVCVKIQRSKRDRDEAKADRKESEVLKVRQQQQQSVGDRISLHFLVFLWATSCLHYKWLPTESSSSSSTDADDIDRATDPTGSQKRPVVWSGDGLDRHRIAARQHHSFI